jgi:carbonic anhydrase
MGELTCRACVVACIDFRLDKPLRRFLVFRGLDKDGADVVRVAGVSLSLAKPQKEWQREFVLGQLKASHALHQIKEIYLVNHEDCGAYGLECVPDSEEERARHWEDLKAAKELVERKIPGVDVLTYFLHIDGRAEQVTWT